jgi:photosystem I subunit 11
MADPRDTEMVKPYNGDPFVGHLSTPISDSAFTRAFIGNLPAYRKGLSPILRGLEIGLAHGYFLVGPEVKFGPLRDYAEAANLGGLITALALILIGTACMSAYGIASFQTSESYASKNPQAPELLKTAEGWSQLAAGFFIGATGGAFVAYFLLENFAGIDAIFRGVVNQ